VAIVSWPGSEHRAARIEVGLRRAARAEWRSQTVDFRPEDDPAERWRAVGLVIATLVEETVRPSAPPPSPRPSQRDQAPPSPPARGARIVLEAGGLVGPGLDSGSWRRGGWLRGGYGLGTLPLFVTASARFAVTPGNASGVSEQWFSGAAGVGARGEWRELRADVRLEAVAELVRASVDTGGSDSASRWVSGARMGVDIAWMPTASFGVVVGADASVLGGSTGVHVHGTDVGRSQPYEFAMLVGVRLAFR
jgi:hypothetical protein